MTPLQEACEIIRDARLAICATEPDRADSPMWKFLYNAQRHLESQIAPKLAKNAEGEWEVFSGSTITDLEKLVEQAEAK